MKVVPLPLTACAPLSAARPPSPPHGWVAWQAGLKATCPGRHADLMGDGGYDDFLGAFDRTLSSAERRRMARLAEYPRLVAFACRTARCEGGALCSEFPGRSAPG